MAGYHAPLSARAIIILTVFALWTNGCVVRSATGVAGSAVRTGVGVTGDAMETGVDVATPDRDKGDESRRDGRKD